MDPSSDTPANSPFAREYESISADISASVAAVAVRPLGPAAAEASAPSLVLLLTSDSTPFLFMMRNTKSVDWPPSCKPMFAPSSAHIDGAPQDPVKFSPPRQVIAPRPKLPPTPIASLYTDGTTITHSALSKSCCGILSGTFRIWMST